MEPDFTTSRLRILLAVALLGSSLFMLSPDVAHAAVAGENGDITYASDRDGNTEIYTMAPDGSNQTRVTNNPAIDKDPTWSPDATKIAFQSDRDGNPEVYVMNKDGSGQTNLTNNAAADGSPAFSPTGVKIAFISNRATGNQDVWVMNSDGSGTVQLTATPTDEYSPAWSPDGTQIAYSFCDGINSCALWIMNADGSNPHFVAPIALGIAWSPDGLQIAFRRDNTTPGIHLINPDGTGETRLTTSNNDVHPDWSPDGTKILFTRNLPGNREIFVMNRDGTGVTNLSLSAGSDMSGDWGRVAPVIVIPPAPGGQAPGGAIAQVAPSLDPLSQVPGLPDAGPGTAVPIASAFALAGAHYARRKFLSY